MRRSKGMDITQFAKGTDIQSPHKYIATRWNGEIVSLDPAHHQCHWSSQSSSRYRKREFVSGGRRQESSPFVKASSAPTPALNSSSWQISLLTNTNTNTNIHTSINTNTNTNIDKTTNTHKSQSLLRPNPSPQLVILADFSALQALACLNVVNSCQRWQAESCVHNAGMYTKTRLDKLYDVQL